MSISFKVATLPSRRRPGPAGHRDRVDPDGTVTTLLKPGLASDVQYYLGRL